MPLMQNMEQFIILLLLLALALALDYKTSVERTDINSAPGPSLYQENLHHEAC